MANGLSAVQRNDQRHGLSLVFSAWIPLLSDHGANPLLTVSTSALDRIECNKKK